MRYKEHSKKEPRMKNISGYTRSGRQAIWSAWWWWWWLCIQWSVCRRYVSQNFIGTGRSGRVVSTAASLLHRRQYFSLLSYCLHIVVPYYASQYTYHHRHHLPNSFARSVSTFLDRSIFAYHTVPHLYLYQAPTPADAIYSFSTINMSGNNTTTLNSARPSTVFVSVFAAHQTFTCNLSVILPNHNDNLNSRINDSWTSKYERNRENLTLLSALFNPNMI